VPSDRRSAARGELSGCFDTASFPWGLTVPIERLVAGCRFVGFHENYSPWPCTAHQQHPSVPA